jgi:hypothetical protein
MGGLGLLPSDALTRAAGGPVQSGDPGRLDLPEAGSSE